MNAKLTWASSAAAMLLLASGCGSKLDKVPVEGEVSFNGKKVVNGDIRLVPEGSTTGASASAPIVDGKFQITNKGGVPVGVHRVVLRAFIVEDVGAAAGGNAQGDLLSGRPKPSVKPALPVYRFEGREQFLPPEYNERAGLTINVTGDQRPQIENFNLRDSKS